MIQVSLYCSDRLGAVAARAVDPSNAPVSASAWASATCQVSASVRYSCTECMAMATTSGALFACFVRLVHGLLDVRVMVRVAEVAQTVDHASRSRRLKPLRDTVPATRPSVPPPVGDSMSSGS